MQVSRGGGADRRDPRRTVRRKVDARAPRARGPGSGRDREAHRRRTVSLGARRAAQERPETRAHRDRRDGERVGLRLRPQPRGGVVGGARLTAPARTLSDIAPWFAKEHNEKRNSRSCALERAFPRGEVPKFRLRSVHGVERAHRPPRVTRHIVFFLRRPKRHVHTAARTTAGRCKLALSVSTLPPRAPSRTPRASPPPLAPPTPRPSARAPLDPCRLRQRGRPTPETATRATPRPTTSSARA